MNKTPGPGIKRIIFEVLVQILIRRLAEHAVKVFPLLKNSKWVGLEKRGRWCFQFNSIQSPSLSPAETKSEPSKLRREQIETLGHNRSHPAKKAPTG